MKETPYSLTYNTYAMTRIEIGERSLRRQLFDLDINNESLTKKLDMLSELKDKAWIREEA